MLELADETDSKSVGGDTVWVRPPSPAPIVPKWFLPLRYFLFGRQNGFISRWFWRTSSTNGAFLLSNFSLGRFLFFRKLAKVDFACNHIRSFHLAVHVDVGVNIGRSGKTGIPQPHLSLFHCDFILDKQVGAGVAEVVIANRAETILQEHFAENPCHIVRGHKIPAP